MASSPIPGAGQGLSPPAELQNVPGDGPAPLGVSLAIQREAGILSSTPTSAALFTEGRALALDGL